MHGSVLGVLQGLEAKPTIGAEFQVALPVSTTLVTDMRCNDSSCSLEEDCEGREEPSLRLVCPDRLQVATERHSTDLRTMCIELAATCLPDLVVTQTFQALVQQHPDMGMSFVRDVCINLGVPASDHGLAGANTPPPGDGGAATPPAATPPAPSPMPPAAAPLGGGPPGAYALHPTGYMFGGEQGRAGTQGPSGGAHMGPPGANAWPATPPRQGGGREQGLAAASPTTPLMM